MKKHSKFKNYIGDKEFYKRTLIIILPIVIQQIMLSISTYVDNVMVSSYNQIAYTGVSSANKFMFLMNFFWFGMGGGLAIFISQYFGAKNKDKVAGFMQLGLIIFISIGVLSGVFVYFIGPKVLNLLIKEGPNKQEAIKAGSTYLRWLSLGSVFWILNVYFGNTYRAIKRTYMPLIAGAIAISSNIFLNYILINGKFGAPVMGTKGAAIATVISKLVSNIILGLAAFIKPKYKLGVLVFKSPKFDKKDFKDYLKKGSPIIFNELLWAFGLLLLFRYTTGGKEEWINIFNYSQNITDLFVVLFSGVSNAVLIIVGALLGKGDFKEARDKSKKLFGLFIFTSIIVFALLVSLSPALILIFTKTRNECWYQTYYLTLIATPFVIIYGANNFFYFTLRAGGDTIKAFLIDQYPTLFIATPIAIILEELEPVLGLGLFAIFAITKIAEIVKLFLAATYYKKETWLNNLTIKKNS